MCYFYYIAPIWTLIQQRKHIKIIFNWQWVLIAHSITFILQDNPHNKILMIALFLIAVVSKPT